MVKVSYFALTDNKLWSEQRVSDADVDTLANGDLRRRLSAVPARNSAGGPR